ncbi:hypothetical protein G6F23_014809 [Rhizopus arrhizus]|nr:hypothetical protein G6F23_014809 [Rhizopus arrhizus]
MDRFEAMRAFARPHHGHPAGTAAGGAPAAAPAQPHHPAGQRHRRWSGLLPAYRPPAGRAGRGGGRAGRCGHPAAWAPARGCARALRAAAAGAGAAGFPGALSGDPAGYRRQ